MSLPARTLQAAVRGYQRLFAGRPSPCRHVPSCSTYALEAVELHGAGRGGWLATKRVCRCHPWGSHGYDPVPLPSPRSLSRTSPSRTSLSGNAVSGNAPSCQEQTCST